MTENPTQTAPELHAQAVTLHDVLEVVRELGDAVTAVNQGLRGLVDAAQLLKPAAPPPPPPAAAPSGPSAQVQTPQTQHPLPISDTNGSHPNEVLRQMPGGFDAPAR